MARVPLSLRERVDRNCIPEPNTGCWLWTSRLSLAGYGQLRFVRDGKERDLYAHRAAFEAYKGPIPLWLHIDHLCKQHSCVNLAHLEAVTRLGIPRGGGKAATTPHTP